MTTFVDGCFTKIVSFLNLISNLQQIW